MIYTIGNAANYREAIRQHGTIMKRVGGYAFQSVEDAENEISERGKRSEWAVFGLDAEWGKDVRPSEDGVSNFLISDVNLIDMDFCVPDSHEWELVWKDKESKPGTVDVRACVYCSMHQMIVHQD